MKGMYERSHPDHMKLRWPNQSLDGDWREQIRLFFEVSCGQGDAVCWGILHSSAPFAKIPGGRIRLSAAYGLGHSLEAQNKPKAA